MMQGAKMMGLIEQLHQKQQSKQNTPVQSAEKEKEREREKRGRAVSAINTNSNTSRIPIRRSNPNPVISPAPSRSSSIINATDDPTTPIMSPSRSSPPGSIHHSSPLHPPLPLPPSPMSPQQKEVLLSDVLLSSFDSNIVRLAQHKKLSLSGRTDLRIFLQAIRSMNRWEYFKIKTDIRNELTPEGDHYCTTYFVVY